MDEFLSNPAVQGGVAPFVAGLAVALVLLPVRLGALSMLVAFLTCVYLVSGLQFTPLTATRKVVLLVIAAAAVGLVVDYAFRPARMGIVLLALAAAAGGLWTFWPLLIQKTGVQGWLLGATIVAALMFMSGFSQSQLAQDGGLGTGVAAIFAASASYGLYGIALGAGAGGYLLPQMIRGKKTLAGATFTFTAVVAAGLVACAAMMLAQLPWYCVGLLALVPAAARLPAPAGAPVWLQAVIFSLYGFVVAAVACWFAWPSSQ
jgi:hypothetical protein